jgi:hypothetical protein
MRWCLLKQFVQKIIYQTPEGTDLEESAGRECYLELQTSLALQGHGRGVAQVGWQWATDLTCQSFNTTIFTISLLTHYRYEMFYSECLGLSVPGAKCQKCNRAYFKIVYINDSSIKMTVRLMFVDLCIIV